MYRNVVTETAQTEKSCSGLALPLMSHRGYRPVREPSIFVSRLSMSTLGDTLHGSYALKI